MNETKNADPMVDKAYNTAPDAKGFYWVPISLSFFSVFFAIAYALPLFPESPKIYLNPEDDVFTISQRIQEHIDRNMEAVHNNNTDKFANIAFSIPGLARLVFGLAYRLDVYGLLPKKIIELSPFHTSLFITNLASINTSYIFHHCYEFGTTSVFVCMGKPVPDPNAPAGSRKKRMPLGVVMDERIATGIEYSRFFAAFERYLKKPELLETRLDGQAVPAMA